MEALEEKTGKDLFSCSMLVISGNTTMVHFLLGLDAFGVFQSPYAVETLAPDVCRAQELGIPMSGFVYCCPAMENYLGGDIVSGMLATEIPDQEEISVFLDVGTNGELVVGNKDFLLAGAGAAGPALEGGTVQTGMRAEKGAVDRVTTEEGRLELVVGNKDFLLAGAGAAGPALEGGTVQTGMRAEKGAVDRVTTEEGRLKCHVLGEGEAKGICGSGIVDLLSELFLNGWIDLRGKFCEDAPGVKMLSLKEGAEPEYAVEYAPGLFFGQRDIQEFLSTKAAAMTMVEYMMNLIGLTMKDVGRFSDRGISRSFSARRLRL